jgi:Zn-dependent alcohol dehydrogenase
MQAVVMRERYAPPEIADIQLHRPAAREVPNRTPTPVIRRSDLHVTEAGCAMPSCSVPA